MKKASVIFALIVASLLTVQLALAEGPELEPGKWQFTTTMHTPMMGKPQVITDTECITEEEAKKDPLASMIEEGNCKVLKKEISGDTVEFEVECQGEMDVKSKGKGHFTSDGTTMTGEMEITMDMPKMGGKTMTMTQKWEGKRLGDCD
jgi:hypothetical protein